MNMAIQKKDIWKILVGTLVTQFFLFFLLSHNESVVLFFDSFFEIQKKTHQQIFSKFQFSIGDFIYASFIIYLLYACFKLLTSKRKSIYGRQILLFFIIFYFLYQIFWGMLYFQKPLITKLHKEKTTLKEAKRLAKKYLQLSIDERSKVSTNKQGIFEIRDLTKIKYEIIQRQNHLPDKLIHKKNTGIVSIKPSVISRLMSYTGILGYYNPFTAEAQYNSQLPSTYLPFTIAHESAHQLGYAREQEANFVGFIIGSSSSNAEIRYSTFYFTLKQLLKTIAPEDPKFVKNILKCYSSGMLKDRDFEHRYMAEHQNFLQIILGYTNDAFLKLNQQEGSITYSYFVDLLIRYERNTTTL